MLGVPLVLCDLEDAPRADRIGSVRSPSCSSCLPVSGRGIRSWRGPPGTACRCGATWNWPGGCGTRPATAAPWLAVTGTNGKTTTVQLTAAMLTAAGKRVAACGNVGMPVLDAIRDPAGFDALVVELSSFQLHYTTSIAPHASVCLNVADDHLDWHGSAQAYRTAKAKVYRGTVAVCLFNRADDATRAMVEDADVAEGCRAIGFDLGIPAPGDVGVVDGILCDRAFHDGLPALRGGTDPRGRVGRVGTGQPAHDSERARGIRVGAQPGDAGRRDPHGARRVPGRSPPHRGRGRPGRHPLGGRLEGHQSARRPRRAARPSPLGGLDRRRAAQGRGCHPARAERSRPVAGRRGDRRRSRRGARGIRATRAGGPGVRGRHR